MQRPQELSPRSAEPAVLAEPEPLGEALPPGPPPAPGPPLGETVVEGTSSPGPGPGPLAGEAVLQTLKGLTMTVKQEDDDDVEEVTSPAACLAASLATAPSPSPLLSRLSESPGGGRPSSASSRSSPSIPLDRLSPAVTPQPQLQSYHQQQQLQLRQIHQRIKEQQLQLQQHQPPQQKPDRGSDGGRGRGRRRSRWKLKFHHQALPPEYLDHYEASLASQQGHRVPSRDSGDDKARVIGSRAPRNNKRPAPAPAPPPAAPAAAPLPPLAPKPAGEPLPIPVPMPFGLEVLTRYQALLGQGKMDLDPAAFVAGNLMNIMAREEHVNGTRASPSAAPSAASSSAPPQRRALLSSLLGVAGGGRREEGRAAAPAPSKVMTYQDLPYMGEMTLDNMKPRRGRKPKKADICHLIYKNYGTVFPKREDGQQDEQLDLPTRYPLAAPLVPLPPAPLPPALSRTDVQSRIISSLLEKRLTQEEQTAGAGATLGAARSDEPLNLCVRDVRDARDHSPLKLKLMRKHGNFYESNGGSALASASVKSEPASPESEVIEVDADPSLVNQEEDDDDEDKDDGMDGEAKQTQQDMLYWPGSMLGSGGVYVHPLLYGKGFPPLVPAGLPPGLALPQLPQLQVVPTLPPLPPLLRLPTLEDNETAATAMAAPPPRGRQAPSPKRPPSRAKGRSGGTPSPAASPGPAPSPPKRKRSAIFIPPVPPESSNNPTTEVSICKFKFTGGAKPSLQEKKMLSVDAGGNFRYYSGTGDKSMRGYEFFPRESMQQHQQLQLQQQQQQQQQQQELQLLPKSYPQAAPQQNLRNLLFQNVMESLHMHGDLQQGMQVDPPVPVPVPVSGPWDPEQSPATSPVELGPAPPRQGPKRKSRKSLEREKLEKTFKEKGFLIQTQQLESAEGATYCKFRQLRKFTRYLFRSWKDYLPGSVTEGGSDNQYPTDAMFTAPPRRTLNLWWPLASVK